MLVKGAHPVEGPLHHGLLDLGRLLLVLEKLPHVGGGDEDLQGEDPALAVGLGEEALGEDAEEGLGEEDAHLTVLVQGKEVNDPVDGAPGVQGVEGGEDQVARLRRHEGGLHRLPVPHLPHHDHVGVLAEGVLEAGVEAVCVQPHLPLDHEALLVLVQELNGVLNGDDVLGVVEVDVVNEGRQGGALAAPRGPRDQNEAPLLGGEALHHLPGEAQGLKARDHLGDHPHHQAQAPPLPQEVAAEAGHPGDGVGEVHLLAVLQLLQLFRGEEGPGDGLHLLGGQGAVAEGTEFAVYPDGGRGPGLQVDVRGPGLDHGLQHLHKALLALALGLAHG